MNIRKKQELLSLLRQYKRNGGKQLNQMTENDTILLDNKMKQLFGYSVRVGKFTDGIQVSLKNVDLDIKSSNKLFNKLINGRGIISVKKDKNLQLRIVYYLYSVDNTNKPITQYTITYSYDYDKESWFVYTGKKWN